MKEVKKELKIEDVVMKLIGIVQPIGETHTDRKRFENLEVLNDVFYRLFNELTVIIYYNKNAVEASVQCAVKKARKIIEDTCVDYFYDLGYRLKSEQEKKDELLELYRELVDKEEEYNTSDNTIKKMNLVELLMSLRLEIKVLEEELKDVHR